MKTVLLQLTALLLAFCLLTGCTPAVEAPPEEPSVPPAEEPAPQAEEPVHPSDAVTALPAEIGAGFHPYNCMVLTNRAILSLLYEPLFAVTSDFEATPYLCEKLESSADGMTHTLTLRPGVTFSDGSRLTAADAAVSIKNAMGSKYFGQRFRHVLSVTPDSDLALTITTDVAVGSLPVLLNVPVVKAGTPEDQPFLGTGPFVLVSNQLKKSNWWRDVPPPIDADSVRLVNIDTVASLRDSFEYGFIDLACTDPNAGPRMTYHADFELWNNNTTLFQYVGFNLESPVFVYGPIRSAVVRAVDREAIASAHAGGFALPTSLPASPYAPFYNQSLAADYACDPAAAAALLKESEIRDMDGNGILDVYNETGIQALTGTLIVNSDSEQRVAAAQAVADSLNALGFQITLHPLEKNEFIYALRTGNFDLYYGETRLSPNFDLSPFFSENGSLSYGGIADSTLELLCRQMLENDGNAYDLHQRVLDRAVLCPVMFKTYAIYTARGSFSNLTPCLDGVFTAPFPAES